jgi:F-type H+-transporting ATPase subunit epsilon
MTVEIITPEQKLYQGEAEAVQLPGKDGLFQILDKHAPLIATLAEGTVKLDVSKALTADELPDRLRVEGSSIYVDIQGGVIEVNANKAIVLVS